jgi:ATP-dependent DNA helicase 2 subunit 2
VPKKVARQRKDGHVRAQDDDEAMILLDVMKPKPPKPTHASQPLSTQASMRSIVKHTTNADDSDTEPESDAEDGRNPPSSVHKPTTPPRSRSNTPVHPLVGTTYPLADFQKVIGDGDLISQAVEAFARVIGEIVESPEAMKRKEEILICMKALRDVALKVRFLSLALMGCSSQSGLVQEDEVDKYNS